MIEQARDAEAIFFAALEKATPPERAAFVEGACAGQADLLSASRNCWRLMSIARAARCAAALLGATVDQPPLAERPGTAIGPYKLLQQIGEGGMGVVYMAEQQEPVRRKVALKIIKPGMDSGQVIARFEAERQALAMMDHPNIARVLDAGTTDSGRPYFVMELVQGVPITQYCDDNQLDARASGWSCSSRSARPSSTPIRRASSTATSSRPTCWSRCTTTSRCPRSSTSASPRRSSSG